MLRLMLNLKIDHLYAILQHILFIPANLVSFNIEYNFQEFTECHQDTQMFEYNTLVLYVLSEL